MTKDLQVLLERSTPSDYDKLRGAYERLFFAQVTPHLNKIYALAYADVLTGLHENLSSLNPAALAMDNQVIVRLFKDAEDEPDEKRPGDLSFTFFAWYMTVLYVNCCSSCF